MTRLIIVDQSLKDFLGHYAEYTLSVAAEAAKSVPVIVLANRKQTIATPVGIEIVPSFRFSLAQPQRTRPPPGYDAAVSFPGWSFLAELRRGLERVNATAADHLFIHSISFAEIEDLLTLALTADRRRLPVLHIVFRRDLDEINGNARRRFAAYVRAFAHLGLWPDRARFYSDTEALGRQYAEAAQTPFETLPIPFNQEALETALGQRADRAADRPLVLGYLGDARLEKGYHLLPNLAHRLLQSHLLAGKARLRIQSNYNLPNGEPGIAEARDALEHYGSDLVELLCEPDDQGEYYRRLAEIDVVLLPYLAGPYRRRSSGIFAQAVAAGKVVVLPSETQMAAEARHADGAGCVFYDRPEELHAAVLRALDRYDSLARAAAGARTEWCARNSVRALVDKLLRSDPGFQPETLARYRKPLVLHVIDGEAVGQRTGVAAVQEAQRRFLEMAGCRVAAVQLVDACPSEADLTAWIGRAYEYWLSTGAGFCWLAYYLRPPKAAPAAAAKLQNAELYSVPETLEGVVASRAVDLVWTNGAMTAPFLDLLGLPGRVPIVCQAAAIPGTRYAPERGERVGDGELDGELAALDRMDLVVTAGVADRRLISGTLGAERVVAAIPPVVAEPLALEDMAGARNLAELVASARGDLAPSEALAAASGIDLLFVSSGHSSGAASLDWFLDQVYGPQLASRGVTLLLAGSLSATAWGAERQRRFPATMFLAGRVTTLRPLYAAAKIVILPIIKDAALNIKTLEALSYGKPIVATSLALRGISTIGEPPLTFDDPAAFAARILELLGEVALRREEALHNWQAAAGLRDVAGYYRSLSQGLERLLGHALQIADAPARDFEFVEWGDEDTRLLNRFARAVVERSASVAELVEPTADRLAHPGMAERLSRILTSLAARRDAAILRAQPQILSSLPEAGGESAADCIRSLYLHAFLPAGLRRGNPWLLAGCQHLGDVFQACGVGSGGDDRQRVPAPGIDVAVLLPERKGHPQRAVREAFTAFYDDCFRRYLLPVGATLTVIGEAGFPARYPGVFQTGPVADPSPILAAARIVCAPWSEAAVLDPAVFKTMLRALAAGKPLAASRASLWFLEAADRDRLAFATADECGRILLDLLSDPDARLAAAARTAGLAQRMLAGRPEWDGQQEEAPQAARLAASDIRFAEWSEWTAWCGRIIRKIAHAIPITPDELANLEIELADPLVLPVWREMIEAVFVRADAPLRRFPTGPLASHPKSPLPDIRNEEDFLFECRSWFPPKQAASCGPDSRFAATGAPNGSAADHAEAAPAPAFEDRLYAQPFAIDLARPIPGFGWYPLENSQTGVRFRWTGPDPKFTLDLPLSARHAYRIEMTMAPVRPRVFDGFAVTLNDATVSFDCRRDGNTIRLAFEIPRSAMPGTSGLCRIVFRHDTVVSPAEDGNSSDARRLGFAVRSISLAPLCEAAAETGEPERRAGAASDRQSNA